MIQRQENSLKRKSNLVSSAILKESTPSPLLQGATQGATELSDKQFYKGAVRARARTEASSDY